MNYRIIKKRSGFDVDYSAIDRNNDNILYQKGQNNQVESRKLLKKIR